MKNIKIKNNEAITNSFKSQNINAKDIKINNAVVLGNSLNFKYQQ